MAAGKGPVMEHCEIHCLAQHTSPFSQGQGVHKHKFADTSMCAINPLHTGRDIGQREKLN